MQSLSVSAKYSKRGATKGNNASSRGDNSNATPNQSGPIAGAAGSGGYLRAGDSVSDNSATDLLDDDFVDFQDYRKNDFDYNRLNGQSSASSGGLKKPPGSIFDDV